MPSPATAVLNDTRHNAQVMRSKSYHLALVFSVRLHIDLPILLLHSFTVDHYGFCQTI